MNFKSFKPSIPLVKKSVSFSIWPRSVEGRDNLLTALMVVMVIIAALGSFWSLIKHG